LRAELEGLLERSFPAPGDADRSARCSSIRSRTTASGWEPERHGDRIVFAYPVAMLIASAAASPARTQSGMPTPR
jgi:hypothetical protein